jgi:hypothetical protein
MSELDEANADLAWWRAIFDPIGCTVVGWTYKNTAQVRMPSGDYLSVGRKELELVRCASAHRDMEASRG